MESRRRETRKATMSTKKPTRVFTAALPDGGTVSCRSRTRTYGYAVVTRTDGVWSVAASWCSRLDLAEKHRAALLRGNYPYMKYASEDCVILPASAE